MSWLFSQALVEAYSEATCLDGEPFAPSNGENTQQAYCSPDKMTEFSRLSRFGMTFKPLTEDHGEALLMSYLAAFHAKTLVPQGGGAGIDGARSGMWKHMARIIGEVRTKCVFVENSPLLVGRGLAVVLGDLAALGYDAQWFCLSASDCGAPHQRDRIWLVANAACEQHQGKPYAKQRPAAAKLLANADGMRKLQPERSQQNKRGWVGNSSQDMANPGCNNVQRIFTGIAHAEKWSGQKQRQAGSRSDGSRGWPTEPNVGRVANGVAARVDRLKAIGNGQVPRVAATAFNILSD